MVSTVSRSVRFLVDTRMTVAVRLVPGPEEVTTAWFAQLRDCAQSREAKVARVSTTNYREEEMATITGKTKAWLSQYSGVTPQQLESADVSVGQICYASAEHAPSDWTLIGEAEITIQVADRKTILANKVEALKEAAKEIRAEAHAKVTRIEEQIQNLLAITYEPTQQD